MMKDDDDDDDDDDRDRNASDDANDGRQWSAERERVKDENERRAHE